jgi:hypothetical protein
MTLLTGFLRRRRSMSLRALVVVSCTALTLPLWLSTNAAAAPGAPRGSAAESATENAAPQARVSPPRRLSDMPADFRLAPYPGGDVRIMVDSSIITAGSCQYRQTIDDPHVTNNQAGVHGAWKRVAGTCPSKANVDAYLEAYGCSTLAGCMWVIVGSGSGDYYAGGGSGKRATAKADCNGTGTVGFRGFVDVDLIGVNDPSGYTYGNYANLACTPS